MATLFGSMNAGLGGTPPESSSGGLLGPRHKVGLGRGLLDYLPPTGPSPYSPLSTATQRRTFPSFLLRQDNAGEWRWRYDASNGETLFVSSEGYKNLKDAERSIELAQRSALSPAFIDR